MTCEQLRSSPRPTRPTEHIGPSTEHIRGKSEHIGAETEHIDGQSEHIGAQTGHIGWHWQSGHIGGKTGHIGGSGWTHPRPSSTRRGVRRLGTTSGASPSATRRRPSQLPALIPSLAPRLPIGYNRASSFIHLCPNALRRPTPPPCLPLPSTPTVPVGGPRNLAMPAPPPPGPGSDHGIWRVRAKKPRQTVSGRPDPLWGSGRPETVPPFTPINFARSALAPAARVRL